MTDTIEGSIGKSPEVNFADAAGNAVTNVVDRAYIHKFASRLNLPPGATILNVEVAFIEQGLGNLEDFYKFLITDPEK